MHDNGYNGFDHGMKVKILHGKHKGKIGVIYQAANDWAEVEIDNNSGGLMSKVYSITSLEKVQDGNG